ncbi:MAG TPA: type II toxin-antitoxin system PemK/MazF family toxin [Acetobacteraceae bacterium]|nr:type II toxin-antitoxin system PemK/MazF family toxin [Acetobacteraceae bacterium]
MELKRGAVVTASINDPSGKPRPFLVLRSDRFGGHTLVTLLAFTSTITDAPSLRVTVEPTARNGLQYRSQAMIDHIQSVRVQRIGRIIGQLAAADVQAIASAVAVYLGFGDTAGAAARARA